MMNFNFIKNQKSFIGYLTAGQKGLDFTVQAAKAIVNGGVDILEMGIPFSDPIADGPVISAAMQQSLSLGFNFPDFFSAIGEIKNTHQVPIVLFSYLNPLLSFGLEAIFENARDHGVDAILIVDLPLEESVHYFNLCRQFQLQPVSIISPSTPDARIINIAQQHGSFLYYACRNGTTGIKQNLPDGFIDQVNRIKNVTTMPVVCGFGVSQRSQANKIMRYADGFVVGSAFVKAISDGVSLTELEQVAASIDPR